MNRKQRAAGAVPFVASAPLDGATAVICSAVTLGQELGMERRAIAKAALTAAVALAAEDGDPDGLIVALIKEATAHGS